MKFSLFNKCQRNSVSCARRCQKYRMNEQPMNKVMPVFPRSITQILTPCVNACQSGGQDRRLDEKKNLRTGGER
eukprot:scaffold214219_cov73-Cyclotella_meneghiniana.AAC.5